MGTKRFITLLGVLLLITPLFSQLYQQSGQSGDIPKAVATSYITLPKQELLPSRIVKSDLWFSLDFGKVISTSNVWPTETNKLILKFTLEALDSQDNVVPEVFGDKEFELAIWRDEPEAYVVINLLPYLGKISKKIRVVVNSSNLSTLPSFTQSLVRFKWNLNEEYGVKVRDVASTALSTVQQSLANDVIFTWNTNIGPLKYFQLEVLRLYNNDPTKISDPKSISAYVDWSKAGSYIVSNTNFNGGVNLPVEASMQLAEGSGYYLWRVRAVSDYSVGNDAKTDNFGVWSTPTVADMTSITLASGAPLEADKIYFTDREEDKNYNYGRVFAERGNTKEMVTYANHLNQVRQTATYLPSSGVSVVTQTILDNSGRPALVTMPVPVDGKDLGYREQLVKNNVGTGELYSAKDFDSDATFQNPLPVNESGVYQYYKNGADNIPSAQGYPYSRTLFLNDGTGRVKEQSGVGEPFRIHDGAENTKHTTRYSYQSATKSEMVTLFGDEAPNAENVFKTVTIDANQVATVTYSTKEGQVIATGLAYSDDDLTALVKTNDNTKAVNIDVVDVVTNNVKTNSGFLSSKRIYVENASGLTPFTLNISYKVKLHVLEEMCLNTIFDCNYNLNLKVFKVNEDGSLTSHTDTDLPLAVGQNPEYKNAETDILLTEPGSYVVQKELVPEGLTSTTSRNNEAVTDQVTPLTNFIANKLAAVKCRADLLIFFDDLTKISDALNNQIFDSYFTNYPENIITPELQNWFNNCYTTDFKSEYLLLLNPTSEGIITQMNLSTPCCKDLVVPINYSSPIACYEDSNNSGEYESDELDINGDLEVNKSDWPDFEKYMVENLIDCMPPKGNLSATVADFYTQYMSGWDIGENNIQIDIDGEGNYLMTLPGVFNEMVYHMLTDKYSTKIGEAAKYQYKCDDLFNCWSVAVMSIKQNLGRCISIDGLSEQTNVSSVYIGRQTKDSSPDTYQKGHDEHFDDNVKTGFFLTNWMAKHKISKEMKKINVGPAGPNGQSIPIAPQNLVKEFLSCAGYKYAKILTPYDAIPLPEDAYTASGFKYSVTDYTDVKRKPIPVNYSYGTTDDYLKDGNINYLKLDDGSHYYLPVVNNDGSKWGPHEKLDPEKQIFQQVYNPYYAFKYFHYESTPAYQQLENSVCFSDPNDCYKLDELVNSGYYEVTETAGTWVRLTSPCCLYYYSSVFLNATNATIQTNCTAPGCYFDADYISNDNGKCVVRDFSEVGRIRCPYSYDKWNASQRYTFLQMLRNYIVPTDATWTTSGDLTITDYTTKQNWYYNTYETENSYDFLVTKEGYDKIPIDDQKLFADVPVATELKDANGQFIMVLKDMDDRVQDCTNKCEEMRGEFAAKLRAMLYERCYEIGGCRTDNVLTSNIIPEDDFDMMVDNLVAHCGEQCQLNTFAVDLVVSRDLETPSHIFGTNSTTIKTQFGMGGHPDPSSIGTADITNRSQFETKYWKYNLFDGNGMEATFSWFQYTMLNQVEAWDFVVTLPDKCSDVTNEVPDLPKPVDATNTHYIERNAYEINKNVLPDGTEPKLNDAVISPSVILELGSGTGYESDGKKTNP